QRHARRVLRGVAMVIDDGEVHRGIGGGVVVDGDEYIGGRVACQLGADAKWNVGVVLASQDDSRTPRLQQVPQDESDAEVDPLLPLAGGSDPITVGGCRPAMAGVHYDGAATERFIRSPAGVCARGDEAEREQEGGCPACGRSPHSVPAAASRSIAARAWSIIGRNRSSASSRRARNCAYASCASMFRPRRS